MNINDLLQKCVNYGTKGISTKDVACALSITRSKAYSELVKLKRFGKVDHHKHGKYSFWEIKLKPTLPPSYEYDMDYVVRKASPNGFNTASMMSMYNNCVRPTITPFNYLENEDINSGFSIINT